MRTQKLCLSQGKDYERTTVANLKIAVENEEELWVCKGKSAGPPDTAVVKVKVTDVNDPPQFNTNPADVFVIEEEKPGKLLLTPDAYDVDSDVSQMRLVSAV